MRYTVSGASSGSYTEQSGTITGLLFSATATTPGDITIAQMEQVFVNVELRRRGSDPNTIVSAPVFPLVAASAPGSLGSKAVAVGASGFSGIIDFGGCVRLADGDTFNVTLNVSGSPATGASATISTLFGVGNEVYTPRVTVYTILKNLTTETIPAGDNVNCIAVVNSSTAHVITAMSAQSDYWQCNYSTAEFDALLGNQWETASPEYWGYQIYNGPEINRCNLTASVNTGASGNAYVVVYGGRTSEVVSKRAVTTANKIISRLKGRYLPK